MASMDNGIYNFTGGVNIEPDAAPQNAFQRFVRGMEGAQMRTAERQERSRNPLYDLQKMMVEQRINSNALQLSDALYQKQLRIGAEAGQQALSIMFSEAMGRDDVEPEELLRRTYEVGAKFMLGQEKMKPFIDMAQSAIEFRNRMQLIEKEQGLMLQRQRELAEQRGDIAAQNQASIMERERMKQDEINRRQTEKLKAAQDAYQARLSYLREAGKNDPMLNSKERLFSAKAQAITRDEWAYETPEEVQAAIDKAYQDVFGNQSAPAQPAATPESTNAPAPSRKKYNPETGLLE